MSVPSNDLSRVITAHADELKKLFERVLLSGRYILGEEVVSFERAFAAYIGTKHAIGVNSGTDAIALSLRALGVGAGDEVITTANAETPPVAAIRMAGATPVFADVGEDYVMDSGTMEKRITSKTKVILVVHLFGLPADMKKITEIAGKHGIPVVEDCAQAHGATIDGKKVGTFGTIAAFSFYPTKNLGALGDGGAIVTNDETLAEKVRRIRQYGWKTRYDSIEDGVNSRLDELQAAFLSWGLSHLDEWNEKRKSVAERYLSGIKNTQVVLPSQKEGGREGVWHLFVVQVEDRAGFMAHMEKQGVGVAIHYPTPVYRHQTYASLGVKPADYPVTEKVMSRIVSLPMFPTLTDGEVDAVIAAVNSYTP